MIVVITCIVPLTQRQCSSCVLSLCFLHSHLCFLICYFPRAHWRMRFSCGLVIYTGASCWPRYIQIPGFQAALPFSHKPQLPSRLSWWALALSHQSVTEKNFSKEFISPCLLFSGPGKWDAKVKHTKSSHKLCLKPGSNVLSWNVAWEGFWVKKPGFWSYRCRGWGHTVSSIVLLEWLLHG